MKVSFLKKYHFISHIEKFYYQINGIRKFYNLRIDRVNRLYTVNMNIPEKVF